MTKIRVLNPTILDVLDDFFAAYQVNAPAAVRVRVATVRADLEQHLELEGPRILGAEQRAIVDEAKQADAVRAFARTMHADDLYYALEHYLDPVHALSDPAERETQLDVIAALGASLWNGRLISDRNVSECAVIEFDIAVKRGRDLVKAARAGQPD